MNITRLEIKNLFGYMSKKIDFNSDINLLVGINGSGKTSVLNIINWLLIPSFPHLCTTEFDEIKLNFTYLNKDYQLVSKQNKKEVTIDIKNFTENKTFNQVQASLKFDPKRITLDDSLKSRYLEEYAGLTPEKKEKETWDFLFNKLPKPIVLGLDRTIFTEEGEEIRYSAGSLDMDQNLFITKMNLTPLARIKELASFEYRKYKDKMLKLIANVNDEFMLSSFDEPITNATLGNLLSEPKITINQVNSLEIKVKDYFKENILTKEKLSRTKTTKEKESLRKIEKYFRNLKKILQQKKKGEYTDLLYLTNVNQFKKIKELIKEFKEFESKSKLLYQPLNKYLSTINRFLIDSSKGIYFDKVSTELRFNIFDKKGKIIEKNRDISTLSSGEKQILILLTYLYLSQDKPNIFIIDEPELSLHPKWQEQFLEGMETLMPIKTQLLLATHSPSIVGNKKKYCKVLFPY